MTPPYPEDVVHEFADSAVPVYTWDIMQMAANNTSLATDEPELGPAFDGSPTPANIIAANIYEHVAGELYTALYEWQKEQEETEC
jgi:hypothetical protein